MNGAVLKMCFFKEDVFLHKRDTHCNVITSNVEQLLIQLVTHSFKCACKPFSAMLNT